MRCALSQLQEQYHSREVPLSLGNTYQPLLEDESYILRCHPSSNYIDVSVVAIRRCRQVKIYSCNLHCARIRIRQAHIPMCLLL